MNKTFFQDAKVVMIIGLLSILTSCSSGTPLDNIEGNGINLTAEQAASQDENHHWEDVLKKQIERATTIIHGRIADIEVREEKTNHGDNLVYSVVTIETIESLKGKINIRSFKGLGGVIGRLVHSYSISPIFYSGEEVIVFLNEKNNVPLGWSAAKLIVEDSTLLQPGSTLLSDLKEWVRQGGTR